MSLDNASGTRIAKLARIKITAEQMPEVVNRLNTIMKWIEQLNEVNTDGVAPLTSVSQMKLHQRLDVVLDGGQRDAVLANAPQALKGYFTVPKVVE